MARPTYSYGTWTNLPSETTPIDEASLKELEERLWKWGEKISEAIVTEEPSHGKEVVLGNVGPGTVKLNIANGNVFTATVEGTTTTFETEKVPTGYPVEGTLLVTQGAGGKHKWSIAAAAGQTVKWVGKQLIFTEAAASLVSLSFILCEGGKLLLLAGGAEGELLGTTTSTITAIGEEAGLGATGAGSVGFGAKALSSTATGVGNTAVGEGALQKTTSGELNTAIGREALPELTTGKFNVAIGPKAGSKITTAENEIAIGRETLQTLATGSEGVIAIGHSAAKLAEEGFFVAIGSGALSSLTKTTTSGTVAIGRNALNKVQTGAGNTAVGYKALEETTGEGNTAFGAEAGQGISIDGGNTVIGNRAGKAITGAGNVAIGVSALETGSGFENVVVGGYAAISMTSANTCVAIGYESLEKNKTGKENVVIGTKAGRTLTGSGNVMVGYSAGSGAGAESNQLYIANSSTNKPLILGEFPNASLQFNATKMGFFKVTPIVQPTKAAWESSPIKVMEELGLVA